MIFGGVKEAKQVKPSEEDKNEPAVKTEEIVPEHPLAKAIRSTGRIDLAILTGQFTRDEQSGVDVLIIGDVNRAKVEHFIDELEKSEKKELRYTVMPLDNFEYRRQINDRFIVGVLAAKKQVIINNQNLVVE